LLPALVPAAGRGARLGGRKLELDWGGRTLLEATLARLFEAGAPAVTVVLGPEPERLAPVCERSGARWVVNQNHESGMLTSIQVGLATLGAGRGVLIHPADQPLVAAATIRAVAAALQPPAGFVIPCHGGRGGHPVALAADLFGLVAQLDPAVGLRQLATLAPARVRRLELADAGLGLDIDSPQDYERLRPRRQKETPGQR
jgi:molybdenum cofactor cytidylyltransferase